MTTRFTVIERDGCVLIEGALSPRWITAIAGMLPKGAVLAPQLAKMLGANFAFGMQTDVDQLVASIKPGIDAAARASANRRGLSQEAAVWLGSGERGISSNTIFTHLTGVDALDGWGKSEPSDPADVRRCRLLLDQCPDLEARFGEMAFVSAKWAGLVDAWPAICTAMDEEWGDYRKPKAGARAARTYELIKQATGRK